MIEKNVEAAINAQINNELTSSYSYLAMSAYFETTIFHGFARWMRLQATEEHEHAMKLFDYLNERGGQVILENLEKPPTEYDSPLELFRRALEQEREVTRQIDALYETAQEAKDYATAHFLGWFLKEQVEEERETGNMVERLSTAGEHINAVLRLDYEAMKRGV